MPGTNGATAADAGTVAAVTSPSTGWASGLDDLPVLFVSFITLLSDEGSQSEP